MGKKVLVIGSGPSGIFTCGALSSDKSIDVKVYERASQIGGQWAGLRTDLVEDYGHRHSSLYHGLWINGPKEAGIELPNYQFDKDIPSYFKQPQMVKYLEGYIDHMKIRQKFHVSMNVIKMKFNDKTKQFHVKTENTATKQILDEIFDYVAVATGHFSMPHDPHFKGEESFKGKYIHAHDFIDGKLYKGQRVLCIGGSYSAEDIALQCWKFGAEYAHITHRSPKQLAYPDWPKEVLERPILTNIEGNTVTFKDGTTGEYDVIIKCTGYLHSFPFLPKELNLKCRNMMVPSGLYNQCVSLQNSQLFFIGMQDQYYTFTMFQLQGFYMREVVLNKIQIPDFSGRLAEYEAERAEGAALKDCFDDIHFQTRYVNKLAKWTGEQNVDASEVFVRWENQKHNSICGFRNEQFRSIYTGHLAPPVPTKWTEDMS